MRRKERHPTTKWTSGAEPLLNNQYLGEAFVFRSLSIEAKAQSSSVQIPTVNCEGRGGGGWNIPLQLSHFDVFFFWSKLVQPSATKGRPLEQTSALLLA